MSIVDEIKGKLDIVELVGSYVSLKKAGRTFKAPCPFHSEHTPSFIVDPVRQSWHCFGACSEGGDVFSFVMKKEGLDFAGALRLLAQRAGVELTPRRADEGPDERKRLRQAHEAAALYYHNLLLHASQAEAARHYLLETRRLTPQTLEDFQLGFSLDSWGALKGHLLERGFSEPELLAAGLLRRRDDGSSTYDGFRGRIMFPIWDAQGRASAFGSRALTSEQVPKYLNSPQTPIFDKGSLLYPIHKARQAVRQSGQAVIVEGYMDAIVAHQHDERYVVASMGTSLTEQQVGLLKGLTKRIVFALDPDAAGDAATLRGIGVATQALEHKTVPVPGARGLVRYEQVLDAEILVAALQAGRDPDEIILDNLEDWRRLIQGAQPVTDYLFQAAAARHDLSRVDERAALVKELLPAVAELRDPARRAHYTQRLARLSGVEERVLNAELGQAPRRRSAQPAPGTIERALPAHDPLEEQLLSLLIQHPELRAQTAALAPSVFERAENRACFEALNGSPTLDAALQALPPELEEHWERLRGAELPPTGVEARDKWAIDCVRRLKERALRRHVAQGIPALTDDFEQSRSKEKIGAGQAQSGQNLTDEYTESRGSLTPTQENLRLYEQQGIAGTAEQLHHIFQQGQPKRKGDREGT